MILTPCRCIPVAIAVYRYCCVFYSTWLLSPLNKRNLQTMILIYLAGDVEILECSA